MKKLFLALYFIAINLQALEFKVASYNVENLFDLKKEGTEYKEYIPNTKYWNKKRFQTKIKNLSKVIKEIDAHIISLQEIESKQALDSLNKNLNYPYSRFLKKSSSAVGVALLSRFPIINNKTIFIDKYDPHSRYILRSTVNINNKHLIIYVNHWRSKKAKESKRIKYAYSLKKDIDNLSKTDDYIILGDLNSNYNEYQTFKHDKKLNDTYGITGINQVLNTTINGNFVNRSDILSHDKKVHYNLWLELNEDKRFSSLFKRYKNTPDNIIASKSMFDNINISYIPNSFNVFKPSYLFKNKDTLYRWDLKRGEGFSDHLPVYALFSTSKITYSQPIQKIKRQDLSNNISDLYNIEMLNKPLRINNVTVISKNKKGVIIKKDGDRAIFIYKPKFDLKEGHIYDIIVYQIEKYYGLKEIKKLSSVNHIGENINYKQLFTDALKIDLYNNKNQNELIVNLTGILKKGYLYYSQNKKIKIYFDQNIKKPKDNTKLQIKQGHLGIYKSKVQIVVYKQEDIQILDR